MLLQFAKYRTVKFDRYSNIEVGLAGGSLVFEGPRPYEAAHRNSPQIDSVRILDIDDTVTIVCANLTVSLGRMRPAGVPCRLESLDSLSLR